MSEDGAPCACPWCPGGGKRERGAGRRLPLCLSLACSARGGGRPPYPTSTAPPAPEPEKRAALRAAAVGDLGSGEIRQGGAPRGQQPPVFQALLLVLLGAQGQGGTPSPKCDCASNFQKRNGLFCCKGCPAGHYLKAPCPKPCGASTCLPCPRGTFLARENHHETRCARCQACDEEVSQVALKNCSAVADAHCGCDPGWFPECLVKPCKDGSPFRCHPCSDCRALHRHTREPCSVRDTDCGTCLPGFYDYGNSCVSCPTSTLGSCPEPCLAVCGWRQMFWVQVLLAGLVVPLLLGASLAYTYHRCRPCKPTAPDEVGLEALTPLQATHLAPRDSALLAPPCSGEKVHPIQLAGNSWTLGSPHIQEAPCAEVMWSWDPPPSGRALGKRPHRLRP
ncbi:tumor necrosis factor receptor superfamily member 25 isoform X2 [Crocuta crocuta]